jgi:hypothetical protein
MNIIIIEEAFRYIIDSHIVRQLKNEMRVLFIFKRHFVISN